VDPAEVFKKVKHILDRSVTAGIRINRTVTPEEPSKANIAAAASGSIMPGSYN
jgi:hypothetical protein